MIICQELIKYYGHKKVLNNLSFEIREGEIFGLLGPNGAGKTTTIKSILGLTHLDAGKIIFSRNLGIGYSPETPYFYEHLTAFEVLKFYGKLQKISKDKLVVEIEEILNSVGLENASNVKVGNYSKGMLQRLGVAQALLGNPDFLILDEPTAGLDVVGRIVIKKLILNLKERGKTILLNSHILSDIQSVCDRVVIIKDGYSMKEIDLKEDENHKNLEHIFVEIIGGEVL